MNHIITSIGSWGVKTRPAQFRLQRPAPGDIIQFNDEFKYPVSHKHCRIASIDKDTGRASVVDGMGSAFLSEDGSVSISGGPFFGMSLCLLEPMHATINSSMWNWGDHSPGASQGVYYDIQRPIFLALCYPYDIEVRCGRNEKHARAGGEFRNGLIEDSWEVMQTAPGYEGNTEFYFAAPNVMEIIKQQKSCT